MLVVRSQKNDLQPRSLPKLRQVASFTAMLKMFSLTTIIVLCAVTALARQQPAAASLRGETSAPAASAEAIREADRLFSYGADAERERQALAVIERALAADANNYQLLWRAARSYYYVGDGAGAGEKVRHFERGIEVGQRAIAGQPDGVEGHFWLGANYGGYSEEKGAFKALRMVKKIRAEMEAVLRLNAGYEEGRAYLALGELDRQLPGLFGGNLKRAISYLEQGQRLAPQNLEMKLALAEAYREAGRREEARRLLQEILQKPINPARAKENGETQEKARKRLNK
jgi:FimV-like protein